MPNTANRMRNEAPNEATAMTRPSTYQQLLSRGRKAGLTAAELNAALSTHPVQGEPQPGETDCNGFVSRPDATGHRTYQPAARVVEPSEGGGAPRPPAG
jgi:hypothetical protein